MNIDKIDTIESIVLCKLSKEPIGELAPSCLVSLKKTIDEVPKMTLKINKYFTFQNNKEKRYNPLYDEAKVKRYLFINNEEYYLIEEVNENKLSNTKEVVAYKGEQKLSKYPIDIEDIGIQLITNDPNNDVYSLNDLLLEIGWKLNQVDDAVAYDNVENGVEKMRWQQSIDTNWLEFLKKNIAEQFDCLPLFDNINRTIDLIDINTIGEEIKLYLSKDNYLRSKQKTTGGEELVTVLKLKGGEDIDIRGSLPTGYDFVTNFSYFTEMNEMSNSLSTALKEYDRMVEIRGEEWRALVEEKISKERELDEARTQWQISISTIERYKYEANKYTLNGDDVSENEAVLRLAEEKENELILRFKIDDLLDEIDLLNESIANINELCKYETCTDENGNIILDKQLLSELSEFMFVDEYQDDSYMEAEPLIKKGISVLSQRCKPTTSISIDSINFLSRIIDNGFRLKWNGELYFGDIIVLIDDETKEEEFYYFVGYEIDYESNKLSLSISNKKTNRENTKVINQWLKEMKNTKTLLLSNKYLFNDIKKNRLNMYEKRYKGGSN